jgi:lipoprotein signal peptidase
MNTDSDDTAILQSLDPWRWRWLLLVVGVFVLDQGTKWIVVTEMVYGERIQVLSFFAWVRWHNAGAAFLFLPTLVAGSVGSSWS